ncbi:MAG: hypothetical protein QGG26_16975 [Candidatus Undinarchaeales archaeon]|nr:hypothetical protein [Candidatus Undinarchaeales archaeon]
MGTHVCSGCLSQVADVGLEIVNRIEVLERLLLSEVPEEQRKAVESDILKRERDAGESEQLEREREWLRKLLNRIHGARWILKNFIERDAVYVDNRDGHTYVIRDGRTLHVGAPYGFLSLTQEANAAGLKSHKDLMDTKLLERRLDDWNALFDYDEIVELNAKVDDLLPEVVDALTEDYEERCKRFHAGYPDAPSGGEGSTEGDDTSNDEGG